MDNLIEIFNSLGITVRYIGTSDELTVPFGIYQREGEKLFYCDNELAVFRRLDVRLELYFNDLKEQLKIENKLEKLLISKRMTFNTSEDILLEDKETFLKYYNIGVIIYDNSD